MFHYERNPSTFRCFVQHARKLAWKFPIHITHRRLLRAKVYTVSGSFTNARPSSFLSLFFFFFTLKPTVTGSSDIFYFRLAGRLSYRYHVSFCESCYVAVEWFFPRLKLYFSDGSKTARDVDQYQLLPHEFSVFFFVLYTLGLINTLRRYLHTILSMLVKTSYVASFHFSRYAEIFKLYRCFLFFK